MLNNRKLNAGGSSCPQRSGIKAWHGVQNSRLHRNLTLAASEGMNTSRHNGASGSGGGSISAQSNALAISQRPASTVVEQRCRRSTARSRCDRRGGLGILKSGCVSTHPPSTGVAFSTPRQPGGEADMARRADSTAVLEEPDRAPCRAVPECRRQVAHHGAPPFAPPAPDADGRGPRNHGVRKPATAAIPQQEQNAQRCNLVGVRGAIAPVLAASAPAVQRRALSTV